MYNNSHIHMEYDIKESTPDRNKRIYMGIVGDKFSSTFLMSFISVIGALLREGKYDINIVPGTSNPLTSAHLQSLGVNVLNGTDQKPFNGQDYDYWITIDSSIIFNGDHLKSLIGSLDDHPVVTALYRTDLERFNIIEKWDVDFFKKNGVYENTKVSDLDAWKKLNTTVKYKNICSTGLGFFGMRKEVLDKMRYPYFNCDLSTIFTESGKVLTYIIENDMAFCKNIQKAGFKIVVNTDIVVGHEILLVI